MASLIFGAVYLGHHAVTAHRREKQRVKNYERWEGLRDEYDEQRQIQRETRSLDIQRTGAYGDTNPYDAQPILSLRDQQEAGDAKTGWRPQESWTGPQQTEMMTGRPRPQSIDISGYGYDGPQRSFGDPRNYNDPRSYGDINGNTSQTANGLGLQPQPTGYQNPTMRQLPAQMTGSAWDDGLPRRPQVNRPTFENGPGSPGVGRSSSLREVSNYGPPSTSHTPRMGGSSESLSVPKRSGSGKVGSRSPSIPEEPVRDTAPQQYQRPGGMMADLIEGRNRPQPVPAAAPLPPAPVNSSNPFAETNGGANGGERDMEEWWKQRPATARTPAAEKDMQEWWR